MSFYLYNTLTRKKELFEPLEKSRISMYVCGPTVYDNSHIGHIRSAFIFDVFRSSLNYSFNNHEVVFVRNVTDVDDKIIQKAEEEKISTQEVSKKYLAAYHDDLNLMGISKPTFEPFATDKKHIDQMISITQSLIDKGLAYAANGSVYFNVRQFNSYGKLSRQDIDQMLENWRQEPGEGKKDNLDFALWKKSKSDEPSWESPWGPGRPGWHIECSAMSSIYCGETFDIHGGGKDLVFPHHENERAQSVACFDKEFARHWVHHGLVTMNSQKMSKSIGNVVTITAIKERFGLIGIDALKLLFLQTHYSHDVDFTWEKLEGLCVAIHSFYDLFQKCNLDAAVENLEDLSDWNSKFSEEFSNDLNTPFLVAHLFSVLNDLNKELSSNDNVATSDIIKKASWLLSKGSVLGLFQSWSKQSKTSSSIVELEDALKKMRDSKRKEKNFAAADFIRDELAKIGVAVKDQKEGTSFDFTRVSIPEEKDLEKSLELILEKAKDVN